jgi:hypothetical protein
MRELGEVPEEARELAWSSGQTDRVVRQIIPKHTPHNSETRRHLKSKATVTTSGRYRSANDKRAHFGVGSDPLANAIDIRWPSSILQHLDNVKADQFLRVDEPSPPRRHPPVKKIP